ncbi:helicase-related protein [Frigidibacter oleivorans]|uniref:helicase-related protein n=1 Tax=Frigidibacter oleivorans TaxID=2487129 RepID=UPI000F8C78FC|nr:helicase-related protein [Frigidibacter oleivorans]
MASEARITAVLGPTNTGKTHFAIERMLAHRSGVIGLPLRLLAREVYDRIVAKRGPSVVALVTGEERIVPDRTQYWVCTVEAMPEGIGAEFLAIDEIQLCADPERGHVFTDRLLRARGMSETMFLGSHTMRGAIAALVPRVQFVGRERFSTLSYTGSKKISRMPPRSAIVGFSVDNVYAIAELIRRQKGGCAVVMGALSPRTRNAQVAMYQEGEVDYLVATDAIGMGLNLDIGHVAFSATAKFDGRRMRALFPHELGQIAGRAGRHTQEGTFGVTGEASPFSPDLVEALENHRFAPIRKLSWRNAALDFGTPERLIASLEAPTGDEWLMRARESDDVLALKSLVEAGEVRGRVAGPQDVKLLWDICRIPDFRGISAAEHATLLTRIFGFLHDGGHVPDAWLETQIRRIDRTDGDIDALSKRLAFIRTWTYIAQRRGWVADESHWRDATRAVEDRLSDALHGALTQRFVDRRTSMLLRRLKQKESLVAAVNDKGEVTVEGEFVGRLEGFRFRQDGTASPDEAKTLRQAAYESLKPEFSLRADRFYNAPDTELDFTEQGGLMWGSSAVGKLVKGPEALKPGVEAFVDEEAGADVAEKVKRRLQHFIDRKVATLYDPLLAMSRDETLTGLARGFAFRLVEHLGVLPREGVAAEVKELDQEARGALRKHGVRFGQYTIFQQALLKPAPTRLRLVLWGLAHDLQEFPESPPPGLVTIPNVAEVPKGFYTLSGYHPAGARAIRIDMLERLADILRQKDSRGGFEATPDMLSITGMTLEQFADLMGGLGYRAEKGERDKARPAPAPAPAEAAAVAEAAPEAGAVEGEAAGPETVQNPIPEGVSALSPATEAGAAAPDAASEAVAPEAAASEAVAPEAVAETEVFYTFTWAPRARGNRGEGRGPRRDGAQQMPRRDGRSSQQAPRDTGTAPAGEAGAAADGAAARDGGRRQDGGRSEGGRDRARQERQGGGGQGNREGKRPDRADRGGDRPDRQERGGKFDKKRREEERPRSYEARPPKEQQIDPDNPFAVLAALRDRK